VGKDVLNQSELADFLGISRKTLGKMVESGEIPGRKIGTRYFFSRKAVEDWLSGAPKGTDGKVTHDNGLKEENRRLKAKIEELEEELEEILGELELFRKAVPCCVCGEPMYPDEKLTEHIRECVGNWGHSSCLEREKQRKESEEKSE